MTFDGVLGHIVIGPHRVEIDELRSPTTICDLFQRASAWRAPLRNELERLLDDLRLVRGAEGRRGHSAAEVRERLARLEAEAR